MDTDKGQETCGQENAISPQRREGRREDTRKKFCLIRAILTDSTARVAEKKGEGERLISNPPRIGGELRSIESRSALLLHSEHHPEAGFAAHHAIISLGNFLERINFVHGADAGQHAEFKRIL